MKCQIRRLLSWLLLLGAIALAVFWGMGVLHPADAAAAIQTVDEAPGQVIYRSRQRLQDQHGNAWQAIAFQRISADETRSFDLRLIGFPGVVEIDRTQPLTLTNSLGDVLLAVDSSSGIFSDSNHAEANVGQYDLQPLLPQLQAEIPIELTLPILNGDAVRLSIPPALVQEWHTVAEQQ